MTDMAHEEGVFQKSESTIIKNLLRFDQVLVKDIMTPRAVMKIASSDQTIQSFFEENPKLRFSRIPIFEEKVDNITGFVLKDNVYEEIIHKNGELPLVEIKRDILLTKRDTPIPKLFDTFVNKREHIALVMDEYGSVSGLVTMEDVIETLLGLEIMDESDNVADLHLLARKNWENRAKQSGVIEKNPAVEDATKEKEE
jgi:CBS domain containing-hemolysin-like protein